MSLKNKVAFITGGSSGIGKASARKLMDEGCSVALVARTLENVEEVADELEAEGGEALALAADVSDADAVQDAINQTVEHFGQLNIVLANAGINGRWAPIEELEVDDWKQTLDVNLTGTFYTIKFAVPHLRDAGGGSIIVTSSINGTRNFSLSGASAYATSKGGQLSLAKMLALELAPDDIRVNVICPGKISTQIEESTQRDDLEKIRYPVEYPKGKVPLRGGEAGKPEEVGDLVAYLASDKASLITGTPVWIDGGQSLFMG